MFALFVLLYSILVLVLIYRSARFGVGNQLFAPWPGYVFIFSTYFLLGTLSLPTSVTDTQWLLYSLALVGFSLGCFVSSIYSPDQRNKFQSFISKGDSVKFFHDTFNVNFVMGGVAISMISTAYMWYTGGVPLLSPNVDAAREAFLSNGYIGTISTLLDLSAIFSFAFLLSSRSQKKDWKFYFCIGVCLLFLVVAILAGSRSRLLKFIIPAVILYHHFRRPIGALAISISAAAAVMFIGLIGYYRAYSAWGSSVAQGIGGNAGTWGTFDYIIYYAKNELSTAAYGLDIVIKTIPSTVPHTLGLLHIGPFLAPLHFKIPIPGMFFKEMINGQWKGFGLAATFLAPMYADFSVIGVLILPFLYAVLINSAYRKINAGTQFSSYWSAFYAVLFYFMVSSMRSDFLSFETMWFLLISYAFLRFRRPPEALRAARAVAPRLRKENT